MLYREISRILSFYLVFFAIALTIPLGVAAYYEYIAAPDLHPQPHTTMAFVATITIDLILAAIFGIFGRKSTGIVHRRESLAIVVIIWFLSALVGGLPFYLSHTLSNPVDCYFEAMSGLTTTGASIMTPKKYEEKTSHEISYHKTVSSGVYKTDYVFNGTVTPVRNTHGDIIIEGIEAVGKGVLFWRSFLQWLGGMGIVILFVAILPALGVGGKVLFQAEATGPISESITPRVKETAALLWKIYLGLTLLETALLMITNNAITFFEAITISFSTLSTGGFCVRNESIGAFHSPMTEWVIIAFMIAGSINFTLYFYVLKGRFYRLKDPEFYLFVGIVIAGALFMTTNLVGKENWSLTDKVSTFGLWDALRNGMFQLVSSQTSTGFVTADFDIWPLGCQALMILLMFIGGMSGSTSGGMKIIRFYMVNNIIYNKLQSIFRPDIVTTFKIRTTAIDEKMSSTVLTFVILLAAVAGGGIFFYILNGVDPETSVSIVASMLNNVGIAFRAAGPTESLAFLSPLGKIVGSVIMVMGRLELFVVCIFFMPRFWFKP